MLAPSRIVVLGCSGSGKSTLASRLADKLDLPFIPTDGVYWRNDWTPVPEAEVRAWLDATTSSPRWVLDGNFDAQRDLLWSRAELAVWLDLPWITTVLSVARRNIRWWMKGEAVWGGVRMTPSRVVSGIRHAASSHALKRSTYPLLLLGFPNLTVIRIRSRRELACWVERLSPTPPLGRLGSDGCLPEAELAQPAQSPEAGTELSSESGADQTLGAENGVARHADEPNGREGWEPNPG